MLMDSQTQSWGNVMAQDLLNRLTYFVCCKKKTTKFILLESHIFITVQLLRDEKWGNTLKQDVDFYNCVYARTSTGALCN